jgi:hypothetical protein
MFVRCAQCVAETVKSSVVEELCRLLYLVADEEKARQAADTAAAAVAAGAAGEGLGDIGCVEVATDNGDVAVEPTGEQQQVQQGLEGHTGVVGQLPGAPAKVEGGGADGAPPSTTTSQHALAQAQARAVLQEFLGMFQKMADTAGKKATAAAASGLGLGPGGLLGGGMNGVGGVRLAQAASAAAAAAAPNGDMSGGGLGAGGDLSQAAFGQALAALLAVGDGGGVGGGGTLSGLPIASTGLSLAGPGVGSGGDAARGGGGSAGPLPGNTDGVGGRQDPADVVCGRTDAAWSGELQPLYLGQFWGLPSRQGNADVHMLGQFGGSPSDGMASGTPPPLPAACVVPAAHRGLGLTLRQDVGGSQSEQRSMQALGPTQPSDTMFAGMHRVE